MISPANHHRVVAECNDTTDHANWCTCAYYDMLDNHLKTMFELSLFPHLLKRSAEERIAECTPPIPSAPECAPLCKHCQKEECVCLCCKQCNVRIPASNGMPLCVLCTLEYVLFVIQPRVLPELPVPEPPSKRRRITSPSKK